MELLSLRQHLGALPVSPLFATVSGAHLYGFESPDSDVDLRGTFVLPLDQVVGLRSGPETVNKTFHKDGLEVDLVCHDILKFCRLLHKRSGEILEQLYSPLVVWPSPLLGELQDLFLPHVGREFYYHYRGFLGNQLSFIDREGSTVKEMLYGYRVALTGIHLLKSGEIVAHLPHLLVHYPMEGVSELLDLKRSQKEKTPLPADLKSFHRERLTGLETEMRQAFEQSTLPHCGGELDALNQFVVDVRLGRR